MAASTEGIEMMRECMIDFGRRWAGLLLTLILGAVLSGCGGGGGGNAGGQIISPVALSLTPAFITTGPNTVWFYQIAGGVRPYRVMSTNPSLVVVSKAVLDLNETTFSIRTRDPGGEAEVAVAVTDAEGTQISGIVTIKSSTVSGLSALPSSITVYHNNPALIAASGGLPPYRIVSSNPAIIPTSAWSQSGDFLILARNVASDLTVSLALQDSSGQSAEVSVLVKPAPLLNVFTITPVSASPGVGCGSAVCSGQDGTASVTLRSFEGAPIAGRQVRFDVVQGQYLFYSDNPAQPLISSYTATSDQNGLAVVRFKADVNAVTGAALIRATDLLTGNQVNGSFVIAQFTDGTGTLSIVPNEAKIEMYYNDECSTGVPVTYYVFGGTPPYRVVVSFPDSLFLEGSPVQTNGGGFTVTTRGICLDPANLIVTDATARTLTALLRNKPGTEERPATPAPYLPVVVTPEAPITAPITLLCTNSVSFVISGGYTSTYVASSTSPGLMVTVSGGLLTVDVRSPYIGGTSPAEVLVSDGLTFARLYFNIPAACP